MATTAEIERVEAKIIAQKGAKSCDKYDYLTAVGCGVVAGCLLYTSYDEGSMDVVEYHYNQHLGLLLIYELPDTVKQKETEAEAYSTV